MVANEDKDTDVGNGSSSAARYGRAAQLLQPREQTLATTIRALGCHFGAGEGLTAFISATFN
jgi:hypothetical protein